MTWGGTPWSLAIAAATAASGATAVTADTNLMSELGARSARRDTFVPIEASISSGIGVRADAMVWIELLSAAVTNHPSGMEMTARLLSDRDHMVEIGRGVLADPRTAVEASLGLRADATLRLNFVASARADGSDAVEWSGAVVLARDTSIAIEWLTGAQRDVALAGNFLAVLIGDPTGVLEWVGSVRSRELLADETLVGSLRDARLPTESLTSGPTIMAYSASPFELVNSLPAVVLSVQSGPERKRLLATPGRLRLLRRN